MPKRLIDVELFVDAGLSGILAEGVSEDGVKVEIKREGPFDLAKHFEFFSYIFNVADSAITIGAIFLLIFKRKAFPNGFEI